MTFQILFFYLCSSIMSDNDIQIVQQFVREHAGDDLNRLLLSASRYPEIDIPFAVEQIASRRQIREKLPSWYANEGLLFPSCLAAEQCSSEQTASYKQRLIKKDDHVCDLTGGLGIDSYFFSRKAAKVTYIERFGHYCETARFNFKRLGAANIHVIEGDGTALLKQLTGIDVFYIDPARRGDGNRRVFALQDCEPDLTTLLPSLLEQAPFVIAKLSPMADISQTIGLLPGTTAVHILSVKNDCKELLFVIERDPVVSSPVINCIHFTSGGKEEAFLFSLQQEKEAEVACAEQVEAYLYEPNASVLKAGAFKSVCLPGMKKLHVNSHLYTSDRIEEGFPGRLFRVEEVIPFSSKCCKTLYKTLPQANISTRNFPLKTDDLRKRTRIKEGGDVYLFATTLHNEEKVFIRCRKITGRLTP